MLLLTIAACEPEADTCSPVASAAWDGSTAFEDGTSAWGLDGVVGGRLATGDLDGDGYPDLIVTDVYSNARDDFDAGTQYHFVLMNRSVDGRRAFVDETRESGLVSNRDGGEGNSANLHVLGDVDGDGDLDVFSGRYYDEGTTDATGDCSEIYLNDGNGRFSLAEASDICVSGGYPTAGASFTDYDADGVLDLWVVGFYVQYGYVEGAQDELYRGNGDGTFEEETRDAGIQLDRGSSISDYISRDVRRPAYGATACDVNGDALPDLIASNYGRSWNQLWRNDGATFTEIGEDASFDADDNEDYSDNYMYACYCEGVGGCDPEPSVSCSGVFTSDYWTPGYDDQPARLNGNTFTTVCADIDNDGDNDLLSSEIHHWWGGGSSDSSEILLNDGAGSFTRVDNAENGLAREREDDWNEGDLHAAFFDFDNDGWKDIVISASDYEDQQVWLWRQVAPGQFEEVSEDAGLDHPWPAGLAVADFDRDGDLDYVTGSSIARTGTPWTTREVHLYENTRDPGNWIELSGLPVGTRVEVTAGGITQTQEVSGGYGHMGIHNDVVLHFGLDDVCAAEEIIATRPGGDSKTWTEIAGNRVVELAF